MFSSASLSFQALSLQAATLRTNLQFQPNAGSTEDRSSWFRSLEDSLQLAAEPAGPVARFFGREDWNLRRAQSILDRVSTQAAHAGLIVADVRGGFEANAARFRKDSRPQARLYLLHAGSIREARPQERAQKLVQAVFESTEPAHQTLYAMLDRAFQAHVRRLDAAVALIPDIVTGSRIPEDAAYPHYFEDAHPHLMDYFRDTLVQVNGGEEVSWDDCRREAVELLIEFQQGRDGVDPETASEDQRRRGLAVAAQIPEYSAFQLLCLLMQIQEGKPDPALVTELKRSRNGRTIDVEDAHIAGVRWRDLLKASELAGGIDIIHANIATALELAVREEPWVQLEIVITQVRDAVARLGKATGSSRPEYDREIERLRKLEADPEAGRVIGLRRGRS